MLVEEMVAGSLGGFLVVLLYVVVRYVQESECRLVGREVV